jgi:uncharacterized protein (TIGR03066 family)
MRTLSIAVLGVAVVVCAGTARAQDDNAKKIVGSWEVTKAASEIPAGTTIEFTKDGKLRIAIKANGADTSLEGTYKIEKEKLTVKMKLGDQDVEEILTVKKLTDDALEIEDKAKKVDILKKKK